MKWLILNHQNHFIIFNFALQCQRVMLQSPITILNLVTKECLSEIVLQCLVCIILSTCHFSNTEKMFSGPIILAKRMKAKLVRWRGWTLVKWPLKICVYVLWWTKMLVKWQVDEKTGRALEFSKSTFSFLLSDLNWVVIQIKMWQFMKVIKVNLTY